jgi:hypothetical protein
VSNYIPSYDVNLTLCTGYDVHQQLHGKCNVPVIRNCSRQYRYFTPHNIPNHGTYIDGGLSSHNPGTLVLQELQRIEPNFRRPDQLVSIGTGFSTLEDTESASYFTIRHNPLYQTLQHYMHYNFNGEHHFSSMRDIVKVMSKEPTDVRHWLRRFNLPLDKELPDLADAHAIDGLGDAAWKYFAAHPSVNDLARGILASNFYFQLRCMPMYENGQYTCWGRILCRIPVTHHGFSSLMDRLTSMSAQFIVQGRTLCTKASNYDRFGNYSKPISFRVPKIDDHVKVSVRFGEIGIYDISASPVSIEALIKLQKLDWPNVYVAKAVTRGLNKRSWTLQGDGQSRKRQRQDRSWGKSHSTSSDHLMYDAARRERSNAPSPERMDTKSLNKSNEDGLHLPTKKRNNI